MLYSNDYYENYDENQDLADYLRPLRPCELYNKQFYEFRPNIKVPEDIDRYLASFDPDPVRDQTFQYWKTLYPIPFTILETPLDFPTADEKVSVSIHTRYSPDLAHSHTFFEMVYILEGACDNIVANKTIHMKTGDICILTPGVVHRMSVFNESLVINFLIRTSVFNETFVNAVPKENILSVYFMHIQHAGNLCQYILFHTQGDHVLKSTLELIIREHFKNDAYSNTVKNDLLHTAFCFLLRNHSNHAEIPDAIFSESPLVLQILNYIYDHFLTITRSELAAHFHFSEAHISRLIRLHTGLSLSDILRDIKIAKACSLLKNSSLNVTQISEIVGYDCVEHFNRTFKKCKMMSPTEYRKNQIFS